MVKGRFNGLVDPRTLALQAHWLRHSCPSPRDEETGVEGANVTSQNIHIATSAGMERYVLSGGANQGRKGATRFAKPAG